MPEETPPSSSSSKLGARVNAVRTSRRGRRLFIALPFVAFAALGPVSLIQRWTGLDQSGAVALLLVVLAAGLWITEAISLYVTSFLILFLEIAWLLPVMGAEGRSANAADFSSPFFSNVILLFLGGFVLSTAFRRYMLDRLIARWVLEKTKGEPRAVVAAVIAVTAFLSMWMSNTATSAMMLGLSLPLVEGVGMKDPIRKALPLAVAVGANLGGVGTPIGTPPNAIVMESLEARGYAVTFVSWMGMAFPLLILFLGAAFFLLIRLYPPEVDALRLQDQSPIRLTMKSWGVLGVTLCTGLLWLTGGLHPLATGTVALIPVIVFFGARILDRKDFQGLPWDVLMLAGGGLSLGVAVQIIGLGDAIVAAIPVGALGRVGLLLAIAVVAALMTTFMSNTATANLLVPVVAGLSGVSTAPLLVVVAYACSCTMVLPVSTPPNTMVFSSGLVTTKELVRFGLLISAFAMVCYVFLGPLWWRLLGVE